MIDTAKINDLLDMLSKLLEPSGKEDEQPKKPGAGKHLISIMTVEKGKGTKIPKSKKPNAEEMVKE